MFSKSVKLSKRDAQDAEVEAYHFGLADSDLLLTFAHYAPSPSQTQPTRKEGWRRHSKMTQIPHSRISRTETSS